MATLSSDTVLLIQQIKQTVSRLNENDDSNVLVTRFSLHVKTVFQESAKAEAKTDLVLLRVGEKRSFAQNIDLSFKLFGTLKDPGDRKSVEDINQTLTRAGQAIDSALKEAVAGVSRFQLEQGIVELSFCIDRDGMVSFGSENLSVHIETSQVNTIKLTIEAKNEQLSVRNS
jgi:hypothetical protein